jgi:hypothetical protein
MKDPKIKANGRVHEQQCSMSVAPRIVRTIKSGDDPDSRCGRELSEATRFSRDLDACSALHQPCA